MSDFTFVGKEVTIQYETTQLLEIEGEVVQQNENCVTIQYESRGKLYTELVPFAAIKGMLHAEPLATEETAEGADADSAADEA